MAIHSVYWFMLLSIDHSGASSLGVSSDSEQCKCSIQIDKADKDYASGTDRILAYLEEAADKQMEKCCRNHGPDFGAWGRVVCPESFVQIFVDAKYSMEKGDGGKSGTDVLLTETYVMKEAELHELDTQEAILAEMSQRTGSVDSVMVPVCRRLRVTRSGGSYRATLTISLKLGINNARLFPESLAFDLKGNYAWFKKESVGSTLKDDIFYKRFPDGLQITDPPKRNDMLTRILSETQMLNERGIMDYSLLLKAVELCEHPIKGPCDKKFTIKSKPSLNQLSLGEFIQTCVKLDKMHFNKPVYVNDKKEFLYFYRDAWRIGNNFMSGDSVLEMGDDSKCPNAKESWRETKTGKLYELTLNGHKMKVSWSKDAILKANPHIPLTFATAGNKKYAIVYALIDFYLHETKKGNEWAHLKNDFANYVWSTGCRQSDMDPTNSAPFRTRFLMMWNHRLNDPCLNGSSYYTYFPLQARPACPDGARGCKALCIHLGMKEILPNGRCLEVKSCLDQCRTGWHRAKMKLGFPDVWKSTQEEIEKLLYKNVFTYEVQEYIQQIREVIDNMDPTPRKKYGRCHEELENRFRKFEDSNRIASDEL